MICMVTGYIMIKLLHCKIPLGYIHFRILLVEGYFLLFLYIL